MMRYITSKRAFPLAAVAMTFSGLWGLEVQAAYICGVDEPTVRIVVQRTVNKVYPERLSRDGKSNPEAEAKLVDRLVEICSKPLMKIQLHSEEKKDLPKLKQKFIDDVIILGVDEWGKENVAKKRLEVERLEAKRKWYLTVPSQNSPSGELPGELVKAREEKERLEDQLKNFKGSKEDKAALKETLHSARENLRNIQKKFDEAVEKLKEAKKILSKAEKDHADNAKHVEKSQKDFDHTIQRLFGRLFFYDDATRKFVARGDGEDPCLVPNAGPDAGKVTGLNSDVSAITEHNTTKPNTTKPLPPIPPQQKASQTVPAFEGPKPPQFVPAPGLRRAPVDPEAQKRFEQIKKAAEQRNAGGGG